MVAPVDMFAPLVTILGKCKMCKGAVQVIAPGEGLLKWKQGMLIQDALPKLSDADREFLLSGICDPCFDRMFEEE